MLDIPKNKDFPPDAVQCDDCGGYGCSTCEGNGWLPAGHPEGRLCHRDGCNKPIPPGQEAVYCSNYCAFEDAGGDPLDLAEDTSDVCETCHGEGVIGEFSEEGAENCPDCKGSGHR